MIVSLNLEEFCRECGKGILLFKGLPEQLIFEYDEEGDYPRHWYSFLGDICEQCSEMLQHKGVVDGCI